MAIGNPTQVGTNFTEASGQTSLATSSTCVIPANSLVVAAVFCDAAGVDPGDTVTVSDGTNSYTKDATAARANSGRVTVLSFYDAAGRTATVTASFGSSNMAWIYVFTLSSAATSGAKDQVGTSNALSTALAVTTASTVAQSDEVAFGVYGRSTTAAPTTWPGAGYTSLVNATDALRVRGFLVEYKNGLTGGSTETSDGTLAASANVERIVVTYKGAAAGGAAVSKLPLLGVG